MAHVLRESVGIFTPPVDVLPLLASHAKIIWFWDGDKNAAEAATDYDKEKNGKDKYTACLNKAVSSARLRWNMAHELAHIHMLHFEEFDMNGLSDDEYNFLEEEANSFARQLLMPEDWVRVRCKHPVNIQVLSQLLRTFQVSWEALEWRLDELGICQKNYIDYMFLVRSAGG